MRNIDKIKKLLREHRVVCLAYSKNNTDISEVIEIEEKIIELHNNQIKYMQIKNRKTFSKSKNKIFKPNKEIKM